MRSNSVYKICCLQLIIYIMLQKRSTIINIDFELDPFIKNKVSQIEKCKMELYDYIEI